MRKFTLSIQDIFLIIASFTADPVETHNFCKKKENDGI